MFITRIVAATEGIVDLAWRFSPLPPTFRFLFPALVAPARPRFPVLVAFMLSSAIDQFESSTESKRCGGGGSDQGKIFRTGTWFVDS